jgi:ribosomal protein L7Ae-like RNA K-turn-binding protein
LEKVQQVLQDIDDTNNALKLLKKAGSEQYIVELANKLNKDLQNKQKQFVNMCRDLPEVKKLV